MPSTSQENIAPSNCSPDLAQTKLIILLQKTCSTLYHLYSLNYFTILALCHESILRYARPGLLRFTHVFRERTRTDALCIRRRLHRPQSESANGELKSRAPLKPIANECAQMYSSLDNSHHSYSSSASFPQYVDSQPQIINSIEFTDLTRPQMEDRRRRRSHTTQDKESISNMRIVSCLTTPKPPLASVTITYDFTPPTAPSSTKSRLPTRIPRAQREARAASRARIRRVRKQTPHAGKILHRPRQHPRPTQARSQTTPQRTRVRQILARRVHHLGTILPVVAIL